MSEPDNRPPNPASFVPGQTQSQAAGGLPPFSGETGQGQTQSQDQKQGALAANKDAQGAKLAAAMAAAEIASAESASHHDGMSGNTLAGGSRGGLVAKYLRYPATDHDKSPVYDEMMGAGKLPAEIFSPIIPNCLIGLER